MPYSGQSSRSTSSYSSDKVPLSCQSGLYPQLDTTALSLTISPDSKQRPTYDSYGPSYTSSSLSDPRYASSSKSSSSKSSRSSRPEKIPLSISHGSPSSRDGGNSKANDERYYKNSSLDYGMPEKKPLSCQKGNDERYYQNSSYYR